MAFKQDFWSILGQTIAFAAGLEALSAENVRDSDILYPTHRKRSPITWMERAGGDVHGRGNHQTNNYRGRSITNPYNRGVFMSCVAVVVWL